MKPKLVYVAGPYRSSSPWGVEQNIRAAEVVAYRVAQAGAYPVCPHTNTRGHFEDAQPGEFWLAATLELMRRCDAVVLCHRWIASSGARAEQAEAIRLSLEMFSEDEIDSPRWRGFLESPPTTLPASLPDAAALAHPPQASDDAAARASGAGRS